MDREKRRAVACKSCHALKVKCRASDFNNPNSPCVRCLKTGRLCEIEPPVARKRKRPEDRVQELEQRIERLTAQLHARGTVPSGSTSPGQSNPHNDHLSNSEQLEQLFGSTTLHDISTIVTRNNATRLNTVRHRHVDVINEGILTLQEAQLRYQLYTTVLYSRFPYVKIVVEFDELRQSYPTLFLTVMAIAGCVRADGPSVETNIQLENLAQEQILEEILVVGNKTMELLKALLVWTLWYNTPEMFHNRRYHVFSTLCVNMCFDLGLTGRPYYVVDRREGSVLKTRVLDEPQKEEYRCLVLTVYSLSTSYALFLRRRLIVSWSPYLEECCKVLNTSPNPKHRTVGVFAKITSMMEMVDSLVESNGRENHRLVKHLTDELNQLRYLDSNIDDESLQAFASSVEAFIYSKFSTTEMALKCLHSCADTLQRFANMTPEHTVGVPLMVFGRLMYCFALFLKTVNFLKTDVDFVMIKQLLDTLQLTSERYPSGHVVLKVRLLLYFYLTTFIKNGDIFNGINEENGMDSMVKNISEPAYTPEEAQAKEDIATHLGLGSHNGTPNDSPMSRISTGHTPRNPTQDFPVRNYPHGDSGSALPNKSQGSSQILEPPHLPSQPLQSSNMFIPVPGMVLSDLGDPVGGSGRLDMLSDATMKGFDDGEVVPTDDFWRIFDYKADDQFYL